MEERNYKLYRHILRKEVSGYVYDKYYYGITKLTINARWGKNGNNYKLHERFYNHINKFGWDNFEHEILFENLTKEEAELLEKMYIRLYNTDIQKHGYNLEEGGIHGKRNNKSKKKVSNSSMGKHKGENNYWYGKHFSEEHKKQLSENGKGKNSKKVKNLNTGEIFNSIKEASEKYGISQSCIVNVCKGRQKKAGKYKWAYYYGKGRKKKK